MTTTTLQQAITTTLPFMPAGQRQALHYALHGEEHQFFIDKFIEVAATINNMPKTYEQDGLGDNAIVHLHYFLNGSDWWITEKDMEGAGTIQAFGYACLNGDTECAELGYIGIDELVANGAELDLYWTATTLAQVKSRMSV